MSENNIVEFFNFENKPLTCLTYRGRKAFIAKEIGARLGYSLGGGQLIKKIVSAWDQFFEEGKHYAVLRGADLYDIKKQILKEHPQRKPLKGNQVTVLFEVGVHAVIMRSRTRSAIRLQEYLIEKIDRHLDAAKRKEEEPGKVETTVLPPAEPPAPAPAQQNGIVKQFEGHSVTTITYKGRPCWLVKEVGQVLGYAKKGITKRISDEWSDEFTDGEEVITLRGEELSSFKELYQHVAEQVPGDGTCPIGANANAVRLLTEPGLYLVLAKTNKPVGKRFRKFITREVMPQIARDGKFDPSRKVNDRGELVNRDPLAEMKAKTEMELKLREMALKERTFDRTMDLKNKELDIRIDRESRIRRDKEAKAIRMAARARYALGYITKERMNAQLLMASEHVMGGRIGTWTAKRGSTGKEEWITPAALGKELGVSRNEIGRLVTAIEKEREIQIRNNPKYTMARVHGVVRHESGKNVTPDGYLLGREVADAIREKVNGKAKQTEMFNDTPTQ